MPRDLLAREGDLKPPMQHRQHGLQVLWHEVGQYHMSFTSSRSAESLMPRAAAAWAFIFASRSACRFFRA